MKNFTQQITIAGALVLFLAGIAFATPMPYEPCYDEACEMTTKTERRSRTEFIEHTKYLRFEVQDTKQVWHPTRVDSDIYGNPSYSQKPLDEYYEPLTIMPTFFQEPPVRHWNEDGTCTIEINKDRNKNWYDKWITHENVSIVSTNNFTTVFLINDVNECADYRDALARSAEPSFDNIGRENHNDRTSVPDRTSSGYWETITISRFILKPVKKYEPKTIFYDHKFLVENCRLVEVPCCGPEPLYEPLKPVPEPTTMLLLGTGFLGLAGISRKFKKNDYNQ